MFNPATSLGLQSRSFGAGPVSLRETPCRRQQDKAFEFSGLYMQGTESLAMLLLEVP